MKIGQLNLIAVVGRQGFIGCQGCDPMFPDRDSAAEFQARLVALCSGGTVLIGGRSYARIVEKGFDPEKINFDLVIWDRCLQSTHSPEEVVEQCNGLGQPTFVVGGRYTFESFMPWVEQFFITRAALTHGPQPLYMPELFGMSHQ